MLQGHREELACADGLSVGQVRVGQGFEALCHVLVRTWVELSPELKDELSGKQVMGLILDAQADPVQAGIFLIALRMKRESDDETRGMLEAIRASTLRVEAKVDEVLLGVRPTGVRIARPGRGSAPASVYTFEPFGKYSVVTARLGEDTVKVKTYEAVQFKSEEPIGLEILEDDFVVFDARSGEVI